MSDQEIMFMYQGGVNSEFITHVLDLMQEKMGSQHESSDLAHKVSHLMLESLSATYLSKHTLSNQVYEQAVFLVKRKSDAYCLVTGMEMSAEKAVRYEKEVAKINALPPAKLQDYHTSLSQQPNGDENEMIQLGLVDMKLKSGKELVCDNQELETGAHFLVLELQLDQQRGQ